RAGFRVTALIGGALATLGAASMLLLTAHSSLLEVAASCFVIGIGMGLSASPTLIAAQTSVEWTERGVVTSTNMFARSIGSAVGVAIFGAVVNSLVGHGNHPAPAALFSAVHWVFLGVAAMALVMAVAASGMPKGKVPAAVVPEPA